MRFVSTLGSMAIAAAAFASLPHDAYAQAAYPQKPIRMIVPFAPGGSSDVIARIIAPKLSDTIGQQIYIENRSGASGNIGMEVAAHAVPDGYTIFLGNIGAIAINPAIFRSLTINPAKDFVAVIEVADVPSVLVANPAFPPNSVAEVIEYARAHPNVINFGSTGSGALSRLEMERLRAIANIDVVHVPYKGGAGPAVTGMLSGETHVMFASLGSVAAFIRAGRLKALAVATEKRIPQLPQTPTMVEAGFPQMVSGSWQGVFVPAGTPRPIVARLHAAFATALASPEMVQRLADSGVPVVTSKTPEAFALFVEEEARRWGAVAREAGATVD
jgi:tripartite-type tricarboxylate transporter receptor subunit TctC